MIPGIVAGVPVEAGAGAWVTSESWVPNNNSAGWSGYTVRLVVGAAQFTQTGSKCRLTVNFGSNAGNIGALYIGESAGSGGTNYAFSTTPVQVLFSGSPTLSLPTGGIVVSDEVLLPITGSADLVIAAYFNGSTDLRVRMGETGWYQIYKSGNDASTVAATGYSGGSVEAALVSVIEVFQP